jgi:catechol 2,3-dioxygenase-like lactoylglutathione lyase family enzyme
MTCHRVLRSGGRLGLGTTHLSLLAMTMLATPGSAAESIADHLAKPSLNVVVTVQDMAAAKRFYGDVLGLEPMPPIRFSDKTAAVFFPKAVTMERFRVGTHEIKLIPGLETTKKYPGGVTRGIGLRMVNYPIPDIAAFRERLKAHGYPMPRIGSLPETSTRNGALLAPSYRFGMLEDPDGNQVEFFFHEGQGPEGWQESLQIALTVSDAEASRRFYGDVLGMQELPSIPMPGRPDVPIYLFQLGPTLIKFWSFGRDLPNYAGGHLEAFGNRYIQYHTRDLGAAYEFVKTRGGKIVLPPTAAESMPVEIMFVADPDGIINEMFGVKLRGSRKD